MTPTPAIQTEVPVKAPLQQSESRAIFFYPDQPRPVHMIDQVCKAAGWRVTTNRAEADLCMLFKDTTTISLRPDDPYAAESSRWINGRMRDISKRTVDRIFASIFGYEMTVDPRTYTGLCIRKSDRNYAKDAELLTCPLPRHQITSRYVYQRYIDARVDGLGSIELRLVIVAGKLRYVRRKIMADWTGNGTVKEEIRDSALVLLDFVFTPDEIDRINAFCAAIGCDFGTIDAIRDKHDGRIYILDANSTPGRGFERFLPPNLATHLFVEIGNELADAFPGKHTMTPGD